MSQQKEEGISIELTEENAQGKYSNLAVITHSPAEFIVDFVSMMPGLPKAKVVSRIILTPQHAKRLHRALQENLMKFESQHGKIQETLGQDPILPMNFGGPQGQA
ncbi:MAG: hypothetical protein RL609_218 [Bacteroidota bacterium]|jgi:hypothetical protein|nr:DUF3467 domain-containing protein [Bacteroidota bacterium]